MLVNRQHARTQTRPARTQHTNNTFDSWQLAASLHSHTDADQNQNRIITAVKRNLLRILFVSVISIAVLIV